MRLARLRLRPIRATLRRLRALVAVVSRHVLAAWAHRVVAAAYDRPSGRLAGRMGAWMAAREPALDEPERLRALFEQLGGSFLKGGQMLAMQPDVLPPAYCRALLGLLDRVPPEDAAAIEQVVVRELGARPGELFDRFDPEPFASASIGQVHRARLGALDLAVKIQRPGAEQDFRADLRILRGVAWTIRRLGRRRWRWIADHLDEMMRWTEQELDYRHEAGYARVLHRQAEDGHGQRVPRIVAAHSSRRVLTMEWLAGPTLAEVWRGVEPPHFDRPAFARQIIDNFLEQVFLHGLFHADLHPANLMVLRKSTVGYLDFGIVGELGPFARQRLVTMTLTYARGDLRAMSAALLDLSLAPDEASADRHRARFLELGERWYERRPGLPRLRRSFTAVLLDMLALSRQTGVWPERSVLKYVRSLMAIDALLARLAPTLDTGAYLEKACRRLLAGHRPLGRRLARSTRRLARVRRDAGAALERLADGRLVQVRLTPRAERRGDTA